MIFLREAGWGAVSFLDSIRKLGPYEEFFRAVLGPNPDPGHLIMTKSGYQYMYFYFPAKMGPNIFILRRLFLIYWVPFFWRFWGPDSLRKLGPWFEILSELGPWSMGFWS